MVDEPKGADGVSAGFKAAMAERPEPPAASGRQLELLGAPVDELLEPVGVDGLPEPRGPGRPPGSRNRSTDEWREYLLSRYPSPLEGLLALATRPTAELAVQLKIKIGEAAEFQRRCRVDALPYLHQKQPQALEVGDGEALPMILLVRPDQVRKGANGVTEILDVDFEEFQGVSGDPPAQSDAAQSDAAPQVPDDAGENDVVPPDC